MIRLDNNRCVRSCRDGVQINRSKEYIKRLEPSLITESKLYTMLGNSVRLKILYLLKRESRLCVCDISEILDMTIPSISQHLKKLRGENIVFTEREGNTIYNSINSKYTSLLTSETMNKVLKLNLANEG